MYRAYFVDDEPLVLDELIHRALFAECGYQLAGFSSDPVKAEKDIKKINPDVVFADLKMSGMSGVALMEKLKGKGVDCEFVIISAHGEFEPARHFFTKGGFDYLTKPVSDHDLQRLLNTLAAKLAGKKRPKSMPESTPSPELNMLVRYLGENLAAKHTLEALSERFGMNRSYICNLFSNYLGTTFVSYMTRLRMEEAARLLWEKQKSVKEISALCGYSDYFYFCRVFREYHFCTPTGFRERAQ